MYSIHIALLVLVVFLTTITFARTDNDLLLNSDECGIFNPTYFYTQTKLTEIDEFPWMARIKYNNVNELFTFDCLAVLVSKQYLVTTMHCLDSNAINTLNPISVVLGDWNTTNSITEQDCNDKGSCAPQPVEIEIEKIILNPQSNLAKRVKDIALIRLKQSVEFTKYIRPICLPSANVSKMDFLAQHLSFTGWHRNTGIKNKIYVPVMSKNKCQEIYRRRPNITEEHICAIVCDKGDISYLSSSALMGIHVSDSEPHHYYLIAIVAYGTPRCSSGLPDVFVRIDPFLNWIIENVY